MDPYSHAADTLKKASLPVTEDKIKKVAEEFESLFLDIVVKAMRKSVVKSGFMDGGFGEDMYGSMLDTEYAKLMANSGTTGLAPLIEQQLAGTQKIIKNISEINKQKQGRKIYREEVLPTKFKKGTID